MFYLKTLLKKEDKYRNIIYDVTFHAYLHTITGDKSLNKVDTIP